MVRLIPEHGSFSHQWGSMPLAIGLFISVAALVALCAKHSRRTAPKALLENKESCSTMSTPKSPLVAIMSPRKFVTSVSNKANIFMYKKRSGGDHESGAGGFGEGGLWQKAILMGEKCQPPEFSGVIHYDSSGKKLSEPPPRSPRASPAVPRFLLTEAKHAN